MPDIFISYAHRDNQFPRYEPRGWVDCFYDALRARIDGIRGRRTATSVWLDRSEGRITGTSVLTDTIRGDLQETSVFLALISPAYEASAWCANELHFFTEACERGGGVIVGRHSRVVKVFKLPTSLDTSELGRAEHRDVTGYKFFERERDGRPLEFDPPYGNDLGREFSRAINSLAYDLADLLDAIGEAGGGANASDAAPAHDSANARGGSVRTPATPGNVASVAGAPQTAAPQSAAPQSVAPQGFAQATALAASYAVAAPSGMTVYLAETSYDARSQRERIRTELQQFGHTVIPESELEHGPDYAELVRAKMSDARLAIHVIGTSYGLIPERATESIVEMQYRIAGEVAATHPSFARLTWIAPGVDEAVEDRQRQFLQALQNDPRLLGGTLEDFKTRVAAELSKRPAAPEPLTDDVVKNVYLIFDPPDREATRPLDDWLFAQGFEVLKPISKGTPGELRTVHRNNLKKSDGVLIYYGHATEAWLQTKLNDLEAVYALGRGRKRPLRARGVVLADPMTPDKEGFRRQTVRVVPGFGGFRAEVLHAFVDDLRTRGTESA